MLAEGAGAATGAEIGAATAGAAAGARVGVLRLLEVDLGLLDLSRASALPSFSLRDLIVTVKQSCPYWSVNSLAV